MGRIHSRDVLSQPRYLEPNKLHEPPTNPLRKHLCHWYSGKGENLTPRQDCLGHITIYGCHWYAELPDRNHDDAVIERPTRAASVHVHDIAAGSFSMELRNIPMSVAVREYVDQFDGTIDEGQTYMAVRLRLRATHTPRLRALAELLRRVRKDGRVDRFGGGIYDSLMAHRALIEFAAVLDAFNASAH